MELKVDSTKSRGPSGMPHLSWPTSVHQAYFKYTVTMGPSAQIFDILAQFASQIVQNFVLRCALNEAARSVCKP